MEDDDDSPSARMRAAATLLIGMMLTGTGRAQMLEAPARLGPARPADDAIKPASFSSPEAGVRIVPDHVAEQSPQKASAPPAWDRHPVEAFVNSRSRGEPNPRHDSGKLGDGFADLFDPQKPKEWLFSDHGFDCIATPISNPFLAEDPRALTELRPIFIYQSVPKNQPNFNGGNIWFFGMRGSVAFTEKLSLTINKLGGISVNPGTGSAYGDEFGFAEFWLGPKYTFWRNPQEGGLAAAGLIFQIPSNSSGTLQDTGSLSLTPYVSVGKTLQEWKQGAFNGIAVAGVNIRTDSARSNYFYMTGHLDFDVGNHHKFYPVAELNWFQYGNAGGDRVFSGQGHDLINTGAQDSRSATLFTGALGARYKITEASQVGFAFELPLIGNRDIFNYRFTVDFIFRY